VCLSSSLGGCFESYLLQPVSPNPRSAFSMYLHIGDNVQFQFGGMGDTFPHTLSRFIKKKNYYFACSCCLEILVDLRIMS
jgi:hypothetical protein